MHDTGSKPACSKLAGDRPAHGGGGAGEDLGRSRQQSLAVVSAPVTDETTKTSKPATALSSDRMHISWHPERGDTKISDMCAGGPEFSLSGAGGAPNPHALVKFTRERVSWGPNA